MNHVKRHLCGIVAAIALAAVTSAYAQPANEATRMESVQHLKDYQVVVFRRYVTCDGVLVSLDVPNNYPQLPIRTDGPFLVWLGVVRDSTTLNQRLAPRLAAVEQSLVAGGALRGTPERVVMDPTPRSRLRWLPDTSTGIAR
jgi:hypothetical protein